MFASVAPASCRSPPTCTRTTLPNRDHLCSVFPSRDSEPGTQVVGVNPLITDGDVRGCGRAHLPARIRQL